MNRIVSVVCLLMVIVLPGRVSAAEKITDDENAVRVLIFASEYGFTDIVKELAGKGVDINQSDVNRNTAYVSAIEYGRKDLAEYLKLKKAVRKEREPDPEPLTLSPLAENDRTHMAVIFAVKWGMNSSLKLLIERGALVESQDSGAKSALTIAAIYNNIAAVQYLLSKNANPNYDNGSGNLPLDFALMNGGIFGAELILKAGGKASRKDFEWYEKMLLNSISGTAVNLESRDPDSEKNLLMTAAEKNHPYVVRYLAAKGANKNALFKSSNIRNTPLNGSTALIFALRDTIATEAALELIRLKVSLDSINNSGETALLSSVYHADIEMARALLDAGANVNRADDFGKTPLYHAQMNGDKEMMALLKSRGGRL